MNRIGKKSKKNEKINKYYLEDENHINEEKNEKHRISKFLKLKIILCLLFIIVLVTAISTGISVARWQSLAQDMALNTPSSVLDTKRKCNCRTWK